jgi:hypothetical protein
VANKREKLVIIKDAAQEAVYKLGDAILHNSQGYTSRVEDDLFDAETFLKRALKKLEEV